MKHIIKNFILFLFVFMASGAVFSFKAYAYDPCVHLTVFYSENITPSENDMFELTYRFRDEADTATITFDASLLYGQKGKILLEPASYEIVGAKYLGDNKIIKSEGFSLKILSPSMYKRGELFPHLYCSMRNSSFFSFL